METKNGILFEEFKTNVTNAKSFEYPEVNIKFKDIHEYEKFLNVIKRSPSPSEYEHILLIKERLKIAKIKDKKKYIFDKLKQFLKERGYTKEITLRSSPFEISKEIDKDGFGFWHAGKGLDTYFNIPNLNAFSRNLYSIEGMVESIMDELVDYDLFIKYKDFKWNIKNPLEFLLYMMSHMYRCKTCFVSKYIHSYLCMNILRFHSLGCVYEDINSPTLEIDFDMNKSDSIQGFNYFELNTSHDGFDYNIRAVFEKDLSNKDGIFSIQLMMKPRGELYSGLYTRDFKMKLDPNHKDFDLIEKILRLKKKIELYVYDKYPDYKD